MRTAPAVLLGIIVISACPSAATAQKFDPYPWCAEYGSGHGGTNCYFMTYEQCMAAISGNAGLCRANLFYSGTPKGRPSPRRR